MIDNSSLAQWRNIAPWISDAFVKQDLVISRSLVEIYNHKILADRLGFRGGTAIQKLYYKNNPSRYSEDLDFVQINEGGIGIILDALREVLEPWLGKPKVKIKEGGVTLIYKLPTEEQLRIKVEINTHERFHHFPLQSIPFSVACPWFNGTAEVKTYSIQELLATKLRALYQRKKGRDLFDLARSLETLPVNVVEIVQCFHVYMRFVGCKISRAEFEQNLMQKKEMLAFREDMIPLLPIGVKFNFDADLELIMGRIISKLPGESWRGLKDKRNIEMAEIN